MVCHRIPMYVIVREPVLQTIQMSDTRKVLYKNCFELWVQIFKSERGEAYNTYQRAASACCDRLTMKDALHLFDTLVSDHNWSVQWFSIICIFISLSVQFQFFFALLLLLLLLNTYTHNHAGSGSVELMAIVTSNLHQYTCILKAEIKLLPVRAKRNPNSFIT